MSRLVVVSNRCNVPRRGAAPGGLSVALTSVLHDNGGLWFGWDGRVSENSQRRAQLTEVDGVTYATVPLPRDHYDGYYKGYSNRVLWPLMHCRVDAMQFEPDFAEAYRRTNEYLARKLSRELRSDDLIWVHDYHLVPLAHELRVGGVKSPIGFFLHVPFPPYDVLRVLPGFEDFLWKFQAYDLIGFQTENDVSNFLECVRRGLDARVSDSGTVHWRTRTTRVQCFPIGIDPGEVTTMADSARDVRTVRRLEQSLAGRPLVVGVDRLDYSKGLPERFLAYQHMLTRYPETVGSVVFLQVAQPSRGDVPEYDELRLKLERIVGEINGHFAEFDWVPLRYVNKSYARSTIMQFLRLSRVGLVTPLRDGMNLVAKEYIAAQRQQDPGVLVLSEFAGAAAELETALKVNPYDRNAVANAILGGLRMPLDERIDRWRSAMSVIQGHDVFSWSSGFERALRRLSKP